MDIWIGMTKSKTVETLERLLSEVSASETGEFQVTVDAENNMRGTEVVIHIGNDDMEDRPEVAEKILVDVEGR